MKLPSLVRLPKYNKFNFEPRYYDPIKDEINARTERIKKELETRDQDTAGTDIHDRVRFKSEMEQAFKRRADKDRNSSVMQMVFILLFISIFVGFLFYGNNALYVALILFPAYILYRKRQFSNRE